ncbi:hypothetical protein HBI28_221980 [Parastagonospora nodorum]|nr:hypothetical protein HBI28_221980 [Parastagonospora nodorum]
MEEIEKAMEEDGVEMRVDEDEVGGLFRRAVRWGAEKKRWGRIEGNKLSWVIGRIVEVAEMNEAG